MRRSCLYIVLCATIAWAALAEDTRSVVLDIAQKQGAVSSNLFSHNLEFTRHDIFEGLSAEIVANWQLTVTPGAVNPPRWFMIGGAKPGQSGVECDLDGALGSSECGIGQTQVGGGFDSGMGAGSTLHFKQGQSYIITAHMAASTMDAATSSMIATLRITSEPGTIFETSVNVPCGDSSSPIEARFVSPHSATNATMTVTARSGQNMKMQIRAVSIMPADAWQGMRTDVISTLDSMNWRGLLRFPGGCFTPFYNWKAALPSREDRPPVRLPADYCPAVQGGVAAYTDGLISNGFSTDEAAALAKRLNTPLALTFSLQTGSHEEIQNAMEWLEYCNGDSTTAMGALRASRGHPEPYGVSVWYLGNEISQQARYPDANPDATPMPPPSAEEYRAILEKLIPALLSVKQDTPLTLLIPEGLGQGAANWNSVIFGSEVAKHITGMSIHGGYYTPLKDESPTSIAKRPSVSLLPYFSSARAQLDQDSHGQHIEMSLDEWGVGPPWTIPRGHFNTVFGLFSASFLSGVMKRAAELGITYANYFEAINEGAIDVDMESSSLTAQGEVFALYARHQDGVIVGMSAMDPTDDVDVMATVHEQQGNSILMVTVANRNCASGQSIRIEISHGIAAGDAAVTVLASMSTSPDSIFKRDDHNVALQGQSHVDVNIPACSVIHAEVPITESFQTKWLRGKIV